MKRFAIAALLGLTLTVVGHARQTPDIVETVKQLAADQKFAEGERSIAAYRAANGVTPLTIEALAALGRAALTARRWDDAERLGREAYDLAIAQLKRRRLDAETHLPIALGAAIETLAQVTVQRGARSEALIFLNGEVKTYRGTSIQKKIQKNINLVSLEGTTAPALDLSEYFGQRPPTLAALKGQAVLLFFWAHWCADCKAQSPILTSLMAKYGQRGLTLVAPTSRFGYVAGGKDAGPGEERRYIEEIRKQYYPVLEGRAIPLSAANHQRYGVSSTPTIVLLDRAGLVRMYHPGKMTEEELESAVRGVLDAAAAK